VGQVRFKRRRLGLPSPKSPHGIMARNKLDGGLLTYEQAADYLSISKSTLYCMVSRRMLPVIRFGVGPGGGGNTRFRLCDLEQFVESRMISAGCKK